METDELIKALAVDARKPVASLARAWWSAALLAAALAAFIVIAMFGPRPDLATVAGNPRFLFKFAFAIALAAGAFGLIRGLSRPGEDWRKAMPFLTVAPALLIAASVIELLLAPPETWAIRMMGANSLACVTAILLTGLGPLAIFLVALRHGASTRPAFAGAVAGLLAGGVSAGFYAIHCTDDSPLFVATWYTMAVAALAIIGAVAAHRLVRW